MKIFRILGLGTLFPAVVLLFFGWQFWVFLQPDPAPLAREERLAVEEALAGFLAEWEGRGAVSVLAFGNDPAGEVKPALEAMLLRRRGVSVPTGSVLSGFLGELGAALAEATTPADLASAGQKVGIDWIVRGSVLELRRSSDGTAAVLEIAAYSTREGAWKAAGEYRGSWSPGVWSRLQSVVAGWSFWVRVTLWIGVVLVLPWLLSPAVGWVVERKSNLASAFLILGLFAANALLAALLLGFVLAGFFSWLGFIAAMVVAMAYPWWVCERIAGEDA